MKSLLLLLILPVVLYSAIHACDVNYRILGGEYAEEGEFPGVVFLKTVSSNGTHDGFGLCGGSLISEHWVLTAAHCLIPKPSFQFLYVEVYPAKNYPEYIQSEEVIVHENFGPLTLLYDIGLIRLPHSMATIYPNFKPVSLPLQGQRLTSNEVTLVGWGQTNIMDDQSASELMKLEHVQLNQNLCRDASVSENDVLCRYPTRSTGTTCHGDSGGPVFMDGLQVGIVSSGVPKELVGYVMTTDTRVSAYRDWIEAHMRLYMS